MSTFSKSAYDATRYAAIRPTYPDQLYSLIFSYITAVSSTSPTSTSTSTNPPPPPPPTQAQTQAQIGKGAGTETEIKLPELRTIVDLGCGPGQVTQVLSRLFPTARIIAVDPSNVMLDACRKTLRELALSSRSTSDGPGEGEGAYENVEFVQAKVEDLLDKDSSKDGLGSRLEGKVDLITAAQAAHWFQYPSVYTSLKKLLKPNSGIFAFWGYSEFRFSIPPPPLPPTIPIPYTATITSDPTEGMNIKWPGEELTKAIRAFSAGTDSKESIGPYWEQPGRSIVESHFDVVSMPGSNEGFGDVKRLLFGLPHVRSGSNSEDEDEERNGDGNEKGSVDNYPTILKKRLTWKGLEEYMRTLSAMHTFLEANPDDAALRIIDSMEGRYGIGVGDLPQRFLGRCQGIIKEAGLDVGVEVGIEWPLCVFMARRL